MTKYLYLISQDENIGYDTYDSAIVCAKSEEDAKHITPSGTGFKDQWSGTWCSSPEQVEVTCLGVAKPSLEIGVVLSSFNAG